MPTFVVLLLPFYFMPLSMVTVPLSNVRILSWVLAAGWRPCSGQLQHLHWHVIKTYVVEIIKCIEIFFTTSRSQSLFREQYSRSLSPSLSGSFLSERIIVVILCICSSFSSSFIKFGDQSWTPYSRCGITRASRRVCTVFCFIDYIFSHKTLLSVCFITCR